MNPTPAGLPDTPAEQAAALIETRVFAVTQSADGGAFLCDGATQSAAAIAFLGPGWEHVSQTKIETSWTNEIREEQVMVLRRDDIWVTACVRHNDLRMVNGAEKMGSWEALTPIQRANEIAMVLMARLPVGVGPDGLLAALGKVVETNRFGADSAPWSAAARLLLSGDGMSEGEVAAVQESLFMLALAAPRLSGVLGRSCRVV